MEGFLNQALETQYISPQPSLAWDLKLVQQMLINLHLDSSTQKFWQDMARVKDHLTE
jgi:hypothetical protein